MKRRNNLLKGKAKYLFPFLFRKLLIGICAILFLVSLYKIFDYHYESYKSMSKNEELIELIYYEEFEYSFEDKYEDLLAKNSDMIGWISIEDTKLNYPVMQTKEEEEYYLRRNFEKNYEFRGTLFANIEANFFTKNDNVIIYGHNMDDGTMFRTLRKYLNKSFFEKHRFILFETISGAYTYEIIYVIKTVDNTEHPLYIDYSNFYNIKDEETFNEQMKRYNDASLYEVSKVPQFGDELLTLSTCEYSHENGRLIIIAKKINERN